jgi:hypothetical protein
MRISAFVNSGASDESLSSANCFSACAKDNKSTTSSQSVSARNWLISAAAKDMWQSRLD